MKILVLDNYDSFTYNLVHCIEKISNAQLDVFRNDEIKLEEIKKYDKIVLSPGPGLPADAGILNNVIKEYSNTKSILGVCLGMQAIGEVFGASLINLKTVFHGVASPIKIIENDILFKNIPNSFLAGRYHSWVIKNNTLPSDFLVTAVDMENNIMAFSHTKKDIKGVQFHPESILTHFGEQLLKNWITQ